MFWTTKEFQWSRLVINQLMTYLLSVGGTFPLAAAKIRLVSAGPPPGPDSVTADFTPAAFTGYADATITLTGTPFNLGPETQALFANATFNATTATPFVPDNLIGYIITEAGGLYVGGELFEAVVPIVHPGDFVALEVLFPFNLIVSTNQ